MITFLSGNNNYQKQKYLAALKSNYNDLNLIELDKPSLNELKEICSNPPILSDSRLVIVLDSSGLNIKPNFNTPVWLNLIILSSKDQSKKYPDYVHKDFKLLKGPKQYQKYIKDAAKKLNIVFVDEETLSYFHTLVGDDEGTIDNELSKLKDKKITIDYLSEHTDYLRSITTYMVLDEVFSGNLDNVSPILSTYLESGGKVLDIINLLIWRIRRALVFHSMRTSETEKRKVLSLTPYTVRFVKADIKKLKTPDKWFIDLGYLNSYYTTREQLERFLMSLTVH